MKTWIATLLACAALLTAGWAMAGDMTPPAGPDQPTMNTLQEIHDDVQALENRLNSAPTRKTGQDFSPPDPDGGEVDYDDGDLQKGVAWPDPRFTDNEDCTVTDNLTGLIWLQNATCLGWRTWEESMDRIYRLEDGQCGLEDGSRKGDWRLPNVNEMQSLFIFNNEVTGPALREGHPFTNVTDLFEDFFTSTTLAYHTKDDPKNYAWTVYAGEGHTGCHVKTESRRVWPVRGGMYGQ